MKIDGANDFVYLAARFTKQLGMEMRKITDKKQKILEEEVTE
jgi:hypothetical protein